MDMTSQDTFDTPSGCDGRDGGCPKPKSPESATGRLSDAQLASIVGMAGASTSGMLASNYAQVSRRWAQAVRDARTTLTVSGHHKEDRWEALIRQASAMPLLERIVFVETNVRAKHLVALREAGRGRVTSLSFHKCLALPSSTLHAVARTFPGIEVLRFSLLTLSEAGLTTADSDGGSSRPRTSSPRLPRMENLRHLSLVNCTIERAASSVVTAQALLRAAPRLETLSVGGLCADEDAFFAPIPGPERGLGHFGPPVSGRATEIPVGGSLWLLESSFADRELEPPEPAMTRATARLGGLVLPATGAGAATDTRGQASPPARAEAPASSSGPAAGPSGGTGDAAAMPPAGAPTADREPASPPPSLARAFLESVADALPAPDARPAALVTSLDSIVAVTRRLCGPEDGRPSPRLAALAEALAFAAVARTHPGHMTRLHQACVLNDAAAVVPELLIGADISQTAHRRSSCAGAACDLGSAAALCALLGVDEAAADEAARGAAAEAEAALTAAEAGGGGASGARSESDDDDDDEAAAAHEGAPGAAGATGSASTAPPAAAASPTAETGGPAGAGLSAPAGTALGGAARAPRSGCVADPEGALWAGTVLARARGLDPQAVLDRARRSARVSLVSRNLKNENARHIAAIKAEPHCLAAVLHAEETLREEVSAGRARLPEAALVPLRPATAATIGGPASARAVFAAAGSAAAGPSGAAAAAPAAGDELDPRPAVFPGETEAAAALRHASTSTNGWSSLHASGLRGSPAVLQMLLSRAGEDLEARNRHGQTPLHVAAWSMGRDEACRLLLHAGASPLAPDGAGNLPWKIAEERCQSGHLVGLLKEAACAAATTDAERANARRGTDGRQQRRTKGRRRRKAKPPAADS